MTQLSCVSSFHNSLDTFFVILPSVSASFSSSTKFLVLVIIQVISSGQWLSFQPFLALCSVALGGLVEPRLLVEPICSRLCCF